jgi:BirA family biotin operon repressor/biotin-[acetyl-CoA-carboxylase] ligase
MRMGLDRLDIDRVLAETFVARAEYHAVIGSTNDRAKELAAAGPGALPLVVVADQQTAGRGRGTNRWWTGRGSLAFSLLVDAAALGTDAAVSPLVGLAAAVAMVDSIAPLLPKHRVGIHWPNDVIAAGRKLAGVLVETLADRRHVVGIGLNLNNALPEAPAELRETATSLLELTGREHDRTEVLVRLLQHLEAVFAHLAAEPQQVALRADALCLQHGKLLRIEQGNQFLIGHCAGVGPDGALILETPTGRRRVYSGTLRP